VGAHDSHGEAERQGDHADYGDAECPGPHVDGVLQNVPVGAVAEERADFCAAKAAMRKLDLTQCVCLGT
jgi:hypothetical protein